MKKDSGAGGAKGAEHRFDEAAEALRGMLEGRGCAYEIFFEEDEGLGAEAKDGTVDALKVRHGSGVGVRVIRGRRPGFAYAGALDIDALADTVERALDASNGADEDEALSFPAPPATYPDVCGTCDGADFAGKTESVVERAILVEKGALERSPEIRRVRKASFDGRLISTRVINSEGVDVSQTATYYTAQVMAVAERDGEAEMGWDMAFSHSAGGLDPGKVGAEAAERALRLLGARSMETARLRAVLENTVVCELLEALSGSFLGNNLFKGKSMLMGRLGEKVFSDIVNIWDDGLLEGGWGTSSADSEGMPMEKTCLVEAGVVRGFLFDSYWAGRMKARPTGNASRAGYAATPGVGITNLYMEPAQGAVPLEELFEEAGSGIFITELMGVHTINPVTGDFSLGASGLRIEGGALATPLRGLAIAGNLIELFEKIVATAVDRRFLGPVGAPSILISELEVSGS